MPTVKTDVKKDVQYGFPRSGEEKFFIRDLFGEITAGADKNYPVDYSQGYTVGAPEDIEPSPETARFPNVNTETSYGWDKDKQVEMKISIFTGTLGTTKIARKNWEYFAIGAALSGITLVCGKNVCGVDPELELDDNGKIKKSPEMDRRIEIHRRYHEDYDEMLIQMNVEDT